MQIKYVYHVVTEKPMRLGQIIIFDENHHNGVYDRIDTFKRIIDGDNIQGELVDFIKSDLNKWAKIANREFALEKVRQNEYPKYPSRLSCLYTSRKLEEAKKWALSFQNIGRHVYSIVKLKVYGNIFDGDARNCFDGTDIEDENIKKAQHYWRRDIINENPVIETLIDGEIEVVEIIDDFHLNIKFAK